MDSLLSKECNAEVANLKAILTRFTTIDEIITILSARFKDFAFHTLKDIPHPQELYNNMPASLMVVESIFKNEKIIIVGDYDADGVCATCIMLDFFESLAYPHVDFAMPNRFIHGYGFSKVLFEEIIQNHSDVKLIITVDNGVSSFEAGQLCKERGIKLIITDHHTLEVDKDMNNKIPHCNFLINPQQKDCTFPYKEICGSLVAWYFCCAIKISMQQICQNPKSIVKRYIPQNNNTSKSHTYQYIKRLTNTYCANLSNLRMESFLLLVGIAIISDVMPLNAINHTICKYALKNFMGAKKYAIQVLVEYLRCPINSQSLGFRLIPLLNAAGRIDNGKIALNFLRSKSIGEARYYFKQLKDLNAQRKSLQEEVAQKAHNAIAHFQQNNTMICVVGNNWHEGVLGIVAGKMAEEFKKPCFVLTHINGTCKGSGRSYGNIDLIASMQKIGHLANRYGGHVGAVGLEISYSNIQNFIDSFTPINYVAQTCYDVLGILEANLITELLFHHIISFEPYGNGNPIPKFFIELEILTYKKTVQGFLEFQLCYDTQIFKAMFFNSKYANFKFCTGDKLQFLGMFAVDTQSNYSHVFNNTHQIMLIIDKIYGLQRKTI